MEFADRTGQELFQLLAKRAIEELDQESDFDRFSALLAASLIPVAEVLRGPIEKARDKNQMVEQMIEIHSKQLRWLLRSVTGKDKLGNA